MVIPEVALWGGSGLTKVPSRLSQWTSALCTPVLRQAADSLRLRKLCPRCSALCLCPEPSRETGRTGSRAALRYHVLSYMFP